MKRYRLVKVTKASGFVLWVIQKKVWWRWEFADSYGDENKAYDVLTKLIEGKPLEKREVMFE